MDEKKSFDKSASVAAKIASASKDKQFRSGHQVALEFSGAILISMIKELGEAFYSDGDTRQVEGSALDMSERSLLTESDAPVPEGSVVSVRLELSSGLAVKDVLAVVKRTDYNEDGTVLGLEFVSRRELTDLLSLAELDLLDERFQELGVKLSETIVSNRLAG